MIILISPGESAAMRGGAVLDSVWCGVFVAACQVSILEYAHRSAAKAAAQAGNSSAGRFSRGCRHEHAPVPGDSVQQPPGHVSCTRLHWPSRFSMPPAAKGNSIGAEVMLGDKQVVLDCRALCSLERLSAYHSRAVDSLQSHIIAALPRCVPEPLSPEQIHILQEPC